MCFLLSPLPTLALRDQTTKNFLTEPTDPEIFESPACGPNGVVLLLVLASCRKSVCQRESYGLDQRAAAERRSRTQDTCPTKGTRVCPRETSRYNVFAFVGSLCSSQVAPVGPQSSGCPGVFRANMNQTLRKIAHFLSKYITTWCDVSAPLFLRCRDSGRSKPSRIISSRRSSKNNCRGISLLGVLRP